VRLSHFPFLPPVHPTPGNVPFQTAGSLGHRHPKTATSARMWDRQNIALGDINLQFPVDGGGGKNRGAAKGMGVGSSSLQLL
jgi:hypothetical protein